MQRVLCVGMSLDAIGVHSWGLSCSQALKALGQFELMSPANLGGDVHICCLDAYDEQVKRVDDQLRVQQAMHQRADALLTTQEQMITRQQDDLIRFEKILATWETQQKQYQKYLDSLPK